LVGGLERAWVRSGWIPCACCDMRVLMCVCLCLCVRACACACVLGEMCLRFGRDVALLTCMHVKSATCLGAQRRAPCIRESRVAVGLSYNIKSAAFGESGGNGCT